MTEAMPFLQKYDITFLRPPTILDGSIAQIQSVHFQGFLCCKPVVICCKPSAESRVYTVILPCAPAISPAASLSGIKFCSLHPAPCRSVRVQNSHNTRFVKLFSFVLCPLVPSFSPQKL